MAKSVFLLNSGRRKMRAQLRRLEPLRGTALKLEGPFRDDYGELSRLLEQVKAGPRCRSTQNPLIATMLALGPQNLPFATGSWLETPFIVGKNPEEADFSSAGDIAACRPVSAYGSMFRSLDLESITMIAVAVLRRWGVPALFAYQHIDPEQPELKLAALACLLRGEDAVLNPIPSIAVMDGRFDILAFSPPEISDFPGGRLIKGLEVLGDEALAAVMKIKTAYLNMLQLMDDMGSRSQYFEGEGRIRALSIGHLFYEGISAWRLQEAEQSLKETEGIMNRGDSGLKSVRRLAEDYQVRTAVCPVHHISMASDIILDRKDKELLNHLVEAATRKEFPLLNGIIGQIPDRGSFRKLYAYMEFGRQIKEHLHPAKLCKDVKPSPGN